jgi:hypothetical protein
VKDQISYLKGLGCIILLVGATDNPPTNLASVLSDGNTQLALIATEYEIIFLGGFSPSNDRIHPVYSLYYNNNVSPYAG